MEERRGESSDVWVKKAGEESRFLLESEVKEKGRQTFLSLGISSELSDSAKITRYAELKRGDNQTAEEYQIALDYHNGKDADVFHTLLKLRLDQLG